MIIDMPSNVYKTYFYSFDLDSIKQEIEKNLLNKNEVQELSEESISLLFMKLNLFNNSLGGKYYRFAIKECYKNPELLNCLNDIYEIIAKEFNTEIPAVTSAMRTALSYVNKFKQKNDDKPIFKIFGNEKITPKTFIRYVVIYYQRQEMIKDIEKN